MATIGRKQVAPGGVIQSAEWGNPLWDQSVNAFNSAADRATQWPNPQRGAVSWLDDRSRLEKFNNGRWEQLPPAAATGGGLFLQIAPYVGQPVVRVVFTGTVTTDSGGTALLMASASIGGGILGVGLSGNSAYCIVAAFGSGGNNLYAKLFNGATVAANTGITVTWWADCYAT